MAESSSEPAAVDLLIEPALTTETASKELIVTTATEGPRLDAGAKGSKSSNGDADSPLPGKDVKDEATPPPPESSLLSSENGTSTAVATDESVTSLLRHIETEGGKNRAGDAGEESEPVCLTQQLPRIHSTRYSKQQLCIYVTKDHNGCVSYKCQSGY